METEFCSLEIYVNKNKTHYEVTELNNESQYFKVDKRYKLRLLLPDSHEHLLITCRINIKNSENIHVIQETGEDLFAVSFYFNNSKICIGTIGDLPGLIYTNTNNSIDIYGDFCDNNFVFYLSYIKLRNEGSDLSAWFAADPSL